MSDIFNKVYFEWNVFDLPKMSEHMLVIINICTNMVGVNSYCRFQEQRDKCLRLIKSNCFNKYRDFLREFFVSIFTNFTRYKLHNIWQ